MGEREFILGAQVNSQIGSGYEKSVHIHRDEDKVAKLQHDQDAYGKFEIGRERFVKAEFYLTKILHLLFPKQIPDIYLMSHGHKGSVHEKKELGPEHASLTEFQKRKKYDQKYTPANERADLVLSKAVDADMLEKELEQFGVIYDENLINFGRDDQGNVIYIDSLLPWELNRDYAQNLEFKPSLNFPRLREAIIMRLDSDEQNQALKYLERLMLLTNEEKQKHEELKNEI